MTDTKGKKNIFRIGLFIAAFLVIATLILNGVNLVPFRFRNVPVSFLTPDLTWSSKPSDVISKYGFPENIGDVSDITGERDFCFTFTYDNKNISLSANNGGTLNNELHDYYFIIDCKTPEEASKYFDECHKKMMNLYKDEADFVFEGTETETDYNFTNGSPASYSASYKKGEEEILIIHDDGNEIPVEEADNITQVKTKVNNYDMSNTVGVDWRLSYTEGEPSVYLSAEIMY